VAAGAAGMAADAVVMAVAAAGVAAMVAVAGAAAIAATVAIAGKQTFRVRIAASRFQRGAALLSPQEFGAVPLRQMPFAWLLTLTRQARLIRIDSRHVRFDARRKTDLAVANPVEYA